MSTQPPPPPPGSYSYPAPPPRPESEWSLSAALNYGWNRFTENSGQIVLMGIILLVGSILFEVGGEAIRGTFDHSVSCTGGNCTSGAGTVATWSGNGLLGALFYFVNQVLGATMVRGALDLTDGRRFDVRLAFRGVPIGTVLVLSLINSVILFVGLALCVLPGVIAGFFLTYSLFFAVDRDISAWESVTASFRLTSQNVGRTLLWYIVGGLLALVGFCLCGVGAIVSVPVVVIGTAFTYRKFTGGRAIGDDEL